MPGTDFSTCKKTVHTVKAEDMAYHFKRLPNSKRNVSVDNRSLNSCINSLLTPNKYTGNNVYVPNESQNKSVDFSARVFNNNTVYLSSVFANK